MFFPYIRIVPMHAIILSGAPEDGGGRRHARRRAPAAQEGRAGGPACRPGS
jgi:hypothetical protein